ncbi:protein kinase domain-containing protein [Kineosporia babensis]|uniref:non-specific serine/threonine protein kinase n=1 Tax=Kineosporia babensis TaxID=499548 RepID=A0A9X1ND66_9ACTN|nr:protein kinase [Kineosporia babensis]MCD5311580.1 protein kinase [Kineosporia babensis]
MDLTQFDGPAAPPPDVPGFRLYELLGFGAHGEVWRAEDLISGDEVALKIGRRRGHPESESMVGEGHSAGSRTGTDYETSLRSRIEHPHIVRLRRVVALPDENLALVLDLAVGGSLAALVAARGRLLAEEVVTLAIPIVSALDHLHQSGFTHGDVSPGNLLFDAAGCPQLGDLGVARVLSERNEDVWSTPGFTDPQLTAAIRSGPIPAEVLRAADLWALAACCWFALTGAPPETAPVLSEQPSELRRLLARSLSRDPDDRPGLSEFADLAWRSAHPIPIRLERPVGGAAAAGRFPAMEMRTTRRVPMAPEVEPSGNLHGFLSADPALGNGETGMAVRPKSLTRRTVPVWRLLLLLGAIGLVGAVTAGVGWWFSQESRTGGGGSVQVSPRVVDGKADSPDPANEADPAEKGASAGGEASEVDGPVSEPSPENKKLTKQSPDSQSRADEDRGAEFAQTLARIARARAQAFEMVSPGRLALADEPGSPADRADQGLLKRLRESGYRLEELDYRITKVKVLELDDDTAEVSAVVSTTAHRQVRVSGGYAAGVPATEPAVMVFTLRASGRPAEGADRWRVHDIRTET